MGNLFLIIIFFFSIPISDAIVLNETNWLGNSTTHNFFINGSDIKYELGVNLTTNSDSALSIFANDIIITGNGHSINGKGIDAIYINNSRNITLYNFSIKDKFTGIEVEDSDNINFYNFSVNNCSEGFFIADSHNITLFQSAINNITTNGFAVVESEGTRILASEFTNNRNAVDFTYSVNSEVKNSTLENNEINAITEMNGNQTSIIGNNITENENSGISVAGSYNLTISKNYIVNNQNSGLNLANSENTVITDNLFNNSKNLILYVNKKTAWNSLKKNGTNIIGGQYIGGNYWGTPDSKGFSQNCSNQGDGFCTEPLIINANNTDFLPLTNPFPKIKKFPGCENLSNDLDGDGLFRDINGNGRKDFYDVTTFAVNLDWAISNEPVTPFDFNKNGRIDFDDIVKLFNKI